MKKIAGSLLIISALFFFVSCDEKNEIEAPVAEVNIIPEPLSLKRSEGTFEIEDDTKFILTSKDERLSKAAGIFADEINRSSSFVLKPEFSKKPDDEAIVVSLTGDTIKFGSEGYSLEVTPDNIFIVAATPAGAFYGMQTLRQLFPPELEDTTFIADEWKIPAVEVFDKPQFHWRGQLFDVSRHFYPLEFVKKNIDYLARYKMNVYHLHLTDDQGWRIEIKKYPKLTSIGAWRVDYNDMDWWKRPAQKPGDKATYGGYYTQEQIKDLVKYAADRFITILPEIDVPGHSQAIIASYPEVSCDGRQYYVATGGVAKDNTVCPGKERTFEFLEGVLDEVIPLFPGKYFHIGGDECNKSQWKKCPDCQRRIREEGLRDEHELQSYFIRRMEKIVNAYGKVLIGWDEILEGGLAPNATVMSWRGEKGGIASAKMGHDVIMSPNHYCYLDLKQGDPNLEPPYGYSRLLITKAYSYAPLPDELSKEEQKHILGVQGNLWGESIRDKKAFDYMLFPRLLAVAEVGWTPKELRKWDEFVPRLEYNLVRLKNMGVGYAPSMYNVNVEVSDDGKAVLSTERGGLPIHYTLDGTEPADSSDVYNEPLELADSVTLKAAAFKDGKRIGRITTYKKEDVE